ncbi:hypothetical protein BC941DRAFT_19505 [Chlamydoabsidia padenii]|nr:hypothetical protein BC941DRAFT_19505 [Chlamydoabsidia padenii]
MSWGGNDGAVERWIKQLEENDPKLVSLHILSFRRISTVELAQIFKAVAGNTTLKELYCSGHKLDRATMEQLSEALTLNDTLELLNIGDATLGHDLDLLSIFCEGLAVNEGLKTLDLENKGLGQKQGAMALLAKSLAGHPTINKVILGRNELNDHCVSSLAEWLTAPACALQCLRLEMNDIGSQGAHILAQALAGISNSNNTMASGLIEWDLSENPLTDGAAALAKQVIARCTSLKTLKMMHVCTPKEADDDLQLPSSAMAPEDTERALAAQQQAQLELASPLGSALMTTLCQELQQKQQSNLEIIWLDQNGIESSGLTLLGEDIKGLKELHLRGNRIDDIGATCLAQCRSLRHVELGANEIGCDGLAALLETETLDYVGLFGNKVNGFGGIDGQASLPRFEKSQVQSLDIGGNGISLNDVQAMVHMLLEGGLPKLTLLEMGGNVEDKDMDAWSLVMDELDDRRPDVRVIWRRLAKEMDSNKPPFIK